MGVVMRGGTSGNRVEDMRASTPDFDRQPIENTATRGPMSPTIHWCQNTANGETPGAPGLMDSHMPTGGTNPITAGGDPKATTGGDPEVFKGATNSSAGI